MIENPTIKGRLNIGGKTATVQELGIRSDRNGARQTAPTLPDLGKITERQQTVAKATADITAAVRSYAGNQRKAAEDAKAKAAADYEGRLKARNDGSYEAWKQLNETERQNILGSQSEAWRQADAEARSWGIGGGKTRALNAGTTLVTGILGGQSNLQTAVNTAAPYTAEAIGRQFGHGENKNAAAQAVGHLALGATLAYVNGGDPLAGGSAALAAEKAAEYLSRRHDDGKTAIDPQTGRFNPNLLPEETKEEIKAATGILAAAVGAAGNNGAGLNAQIGGVAGQNAVENNFLWSQTAKDKNWLSKEEQSVIDLIAGRAGVPSIEYFVIAHKRLEDSNSPNKAKEIDKLIQAYETASRKMEVEAAKLPKGSLERKYLLSAQAKMNNIIGLIPPYEKSPIIRSEQRDWSLVPLPGTKPSGFSRVLREWDRQAGYSADESEMMQNAVLQGGRTGLNGGRSVGRRQTPSDKLSDNSGRARTDKTFNDMSQIDGEMGFTQQSKARGADRAKLYSQNWQEADLTIAIRKFTGANPSVRFTPKGKVIYQGQNGIQIIHDIEGNYFRILDTKISGKRSYLDLNGNIPTNKINANGKQQGRTQAEYNEATHFKIRGY